MRRYIYERTTVEEIVVVAESEEEATAIATAPGMTGGILCIENELVNVEDVNEP